MKTTNTINNTNIRNINRIAEANLKQAIFAAAKESEPSAKQIAKDQRWCEREEKRTGVKCNVTYRLWNWYKKIMDNLRITNEYRTGKGCSRIDIVESFFRLTECEEKFSFGTYKSQRRYYDAKTKMYIYETHYYDKCLELIAAAGLESEYKAWKAGRQIYDCNGQEVRVGDIIRFPNITDVCGSPVENGYEARVDVTNDGLVWIAYPENAWIGYEGEETEHLHIPGVPFTAELAKCAEVIIKREEGFIRHPDHGDFRFPRVHYPDCEAPQIFVKKT